MESEKMETNLPDETLDLSRDDLKKVAGAGDGSRTPIHNVGDKVRLRAAPEKGIGEVVEVVELPDNFFVFAYFPTVDRTYNGYQGAFVKAENTPRPFFSVPRRLISR